MMNRSLIAQIFNLLCRGFSIRKPRHRTDWAHLGTATVATPSRREARVGRGENWEPEPKRLGARTAMSASFFAGLVIERTRLPALRFMERRKIGVSRSPHSLVAPHCAVCSGNACMTVLTVIL